MKSILFLSLILIMTISCRKEKLPCKKDRVYGTVFDPSNGKPVEGAQIRINRRKCGISLSITSNNCKSIEIAETHSNRLGHFELKFKEIKGRTYNIEVYKHDYFNVGSKRLYVYRQGEAELEIMKKHQIKVRIKNTTDSVDRIRVWAGFYFLGSFEGSNIDTTLYGEAFASEYADISWEKYRNDSLISINGDSVFVEYGEQPDYLLEY